MEQLKRIWEFLKFDTYGNIALASFLICSVSGIVLVIPYDVNRAYDSISIMLIANPGAVFFRNLHYWSAQVFVIFTLLHTWEHFRLNTIPQLSRGVWFRLVASLLFVFFVMLTGFILKADADSLQANRIFRALLKSIPFLGEILSNIILGKEEDLQVIYIHHVATATIFLIVIIFEHSRLFWTKKLTFFLSLAILSLLAFFIQAPLQDQSHIILKGPWYFIGLQEILHYTSTPIWMWLFLIILFISFWAVKFSKGKYYSLFSKTLAFLGILYLVFTLIGFYFRGENWKWEWPWEAKNEVKLIPFELGFQTINADYNTLTTNDIPQVLGKREACMICHQNVSGFSPAHDPRAIGCISCHSGRPFSLDKNRAHAGMITIPGNLIDAGQSCGTIQCHPDIPARVIRSLMTTNSGIVSVDRFVFGENENPDVISHITELGHGAADTHLRNLCSKCHLGNEKTETGPVNQLSRGGGCLACHLNYSDEGKDQHHQYISSNKTENKLPLIHPSIDIKISNEHCFGCHSRSGRISTNYEGWHETLLEESNILDQNKYRVMEDKRVFEFVASDIHHQAGMECIDCHDSFELMGDGNEYMHQEEAVSIRCEDCHFSVKGELASFEDLDEESRKIFELRKFSHQDQKMIKKSKSGKVLMNTIIDKERILISKNSGKQHQLKPPLTICTGNHGHEYLSCSACHTAWAPQCIGCHNSYEKTSPGYDLLEKKEVKGTWAEYVGQFYAEAPTLGNREGDSLQIIPAIPGMVMTIDLESFDSKASDNQSNKSVLFHRLFAPAAPHTTSAKGRTCKSCHNNPLAIGYGRGSLEFIINDNKGIWTFTPEFALNENDGLPEDAWIKFLSEPKESSNFSTRTNFRPFSLDQQQKILRVGACLNCHDENSSVMLNSLKEPFQQYIMNLPEPCITPLFKKE